jgi:hypothetical protein
VKPFILKLDGKEHIVQDGDCEVHLFRERPASDYLSVSAFDNEQPQEMWIFNRREICLWIGNIAIRGSDKKLLAEINKEQGSFYEHCGWLGSVVIETWPTEFEENMLVASMIKDLSDYPPDFT